MGRELFCRSACYIAPDMPLEAAEFGKLTALVVEDESIIAFMIEDMLNDIGFGQVLQANSIPQALAALEKERPDIVILDVNLSGVPAYPVAERLQAAGIPFIFASGYGTAGIAAPWSRSPVLQKPFQAEKLADAITACLASSKRK